MLHLKEFITRQTKNCLSLREYQILHITKSTKTCIKYYSPSKNWILNSCQPPLSLSLSLLMPYGMQTHRVDSESLANYWIYYWGEYFLRECIDLQMNSVLNLWFIHSPNRTDSFCILLQFSSKFTWRTRDQKALNKNVKRERENEGETHAVSISHIFIAETTTPLMDLYHLLHFHKFIFISECTNEHTKNARARERERVWRAS